MAKTKEPAKMGRPRKELNFDELEKLMGLQCTLREIAGWFDMSEDTLETRVKEEYGETFSEVSVKKKSTGRIPLRRKQYEVAMAGDKTMLIWLGKQYLGQADKLESQNTNVTKMSDDELLREAKSIIAKADSEH